MSQHVLVSRPGAAGAELTKQLKQRGYNAWHGPTLAIQELPLSHSARDFDLVIFISPPSVDYSQGREPNFLKPGPLVLAVGSGTAKALNEVGIDKVGYPKTFNSEGLLAMAELNQVAGKKVLLVKGVGGRPLLYDTLVKRGAEVAKLDVYERHPCEVPDRVWQAYWSVAEQHYLTSASIETLDAFEAQRLADNKPRPDAIYVASDRIAEHAQTLGYTDVHRVGGATNEHFLSQLRAL